jgi:oligopeptide/dipeptide ABC transporter ATP-binding protein
MASSSFPLQQPGPVPEPLLVVRDLVKHYHATGLFRKAAPPVRAVDGVSFAVGRGETLALVGESGCGKSSVGRTILRLQEPTSGSARFEDTEVFSLDRAALRRARRRMQIIFQDPYSSLNPRMSIGAAIAEGIEIHHLASGPEVGRRVAPVSALDVSVQAQVLNLLSDLQRDRGLSYLFIAHDLAVVRQIARRIAVMYLGHIVEEGPTEPLLAAPRHPYTVALLSAVPEPDPGRRRSRIVLRGDLPSPSNPPSGCPFHTRCFHPLRDERCVREAPLLRPVGPTIAACHYAEQTPLPEAPTT